MWSVVLVTALVVALVLVAWRVRRYVRDIGDVFDGDYRPPPIHDRAGPH